MKRFFLVIIMLPLLGTGISVSKSAGVKIDYHSYTLIEAEDAIVTNFASRATNFFFASSEYTLQLSKEPSGGKNEYFAKFVFFNNIDREYEIWLGATPPGGDTNPYISPIHIMFDGGKIHSIDSKSVRYSGRYTHGGFYFYRVLSGRIPHGQHSLEIIVRKPRKHDGKFVFYLDNIIIIPKNSKKFLKHQKLPPLFPGNLEPRKKFLFKDINRIPPLRKIRNREELKNYAISLGWAGEFDTSLKVYKHLIKRNANDYEAQIGYMLTQIWKGNSKEAFNYLDQLIRKPGISKKLKILLMKFNGQAASWNGKYEKAKDIYRQLFKKNPDDIEAIIGLGNVYTWSGEGDKAISLYKESIKRHADNARLMYAVADSYEKNRQYKRAIIIFEGIMNKFPDDFSVYQKLAALYTRTGEQDKAADILAIGKSRKAVEKVTKGKLERRKDTSKEKIIGEYEKIVQNDFLNIKNHTNLLSAYEWYKEEDKALREYTVILALHLYYRLLITEEENRKLFSAVSKINYLYKNFDNIETATEEELKKIRQDLDTIKAGFDDFLLQKDQVNWELETGNIESRLNEAMDDNHFLYRRIIASLNYLSGKSGDSMEYIKANIAGKEKAQEEYIAPFIFLENGDVLTMENFIKQAKYDSKYESVINDLKSFSQKYVIKEESRGLPSKEKNEIRKLREEANNLRRLAYEQAIFNYYLYSVDSIRKLGNYYISLKNPNQAQSIYREVLKMQPDNAEANMRLGDLCRWSKRYYSACEYYERVLDTEPENKKAIKARDEVLSVYSPLLDFDFIYHHEPIVTRFKVTFSGEYILNDYFSLKGYYCSGTTSDNLGFLVSSIYSSAVSSFRYNEAGVELKLNIFAFSTSVSGGYFLRNYNGDMQFDYLEEYSTSIKRSITHNYFAVFQWMPATLPFSLYIRYEYADVIELTQAIRLGLFNHYLNAVVNLRFDFLPFFPFDRLSLYSSLECRIVSDENILLKSYNKAIFTVLLFPFMGMKLDAGGIYSYEDSTFNVYPSNNPVYRKQANVPYYAPVNLSTYGGFGEWTHNLKSVLDFYCEYAVGMSFLLTTANAKILSPYTVIRGEVYKINWELAFAFIYSKTYQTYETGDPFKSYDISLKLSKKFYFDYTAREKSSKSIVKVATEKQRYSLARDKLISYRVKAFDTRGIISFRLEIRDRNDQLVMEIKESGTPGDKISWNMQNNKGKKVSPGLYRARFSIINKKKDEVSSEEILFKIE